MMKKISIITETVLIIIFLSFSLIRVAGCGNQEASADKSDITVSDYLQQGNKLYEDSDFAMASLMYWNVLKKNPTLIEPRIKLANIYFYQNNWNDDAMVQLDTVVQLEPNNAEAHFLRGKIFRNDGWPDKAVKEYLLALETEPQNPGFRYHLGALYHANQLYEEAIDEYKLAIAYDTNLAKPDFEAAPYGLQARFMLARLYKQAQRIDEAIDELEKVIAIDKTYQDAKNDLIDLLDLKAQSVSRGGDARDYFWALELYERIVQLDPGHADAWVEIGKIKYYWLHKPKEALEAFQKASQLDPTHPDVILHLKSLQQELKLE
ncbi:tetratricopeptide repeat protein [Candidatus Poribacteria bacterium]|nr:tetratricopeptide repeat protein [Candidatus Poribacteria bacterium]